MSKTRTTITERAGRSAHEAAFNSLRMGIDEESGYPKRLRQSFEFVGGNFADYLIRIGIDFLYHLVARPRVQSILIGTTRVLQVLVQLRQERVKIRCRLYGWR